MKQYIILGVYLLSLLVAGCSNDDVVDTNNNVTTGKLITLNAVINNGADTRMVYQFSDTEGIKLTWSEKEKFNLYQGTSSVTTEFEKDGIGYSFKGYYYPGGSGDYYAVYGKNLINSNGEFAIDISNQTGTIAENSLMNFMVAQASTLTETFSFNYKLAVLKLNLEFPNDVEGPIKKISVMGLHHKATYKLADNNYTYKDEDIGNITIANGDAEFVIGNDHKITAYVEVFPEFVYAWNAMIKVEVGNDTYLYTLQNRNTLQAGKVVPVNVKMVKLEYVDLGLPSRTKWATMNVGANVPQKPGGYYAYGATAVKAISSWDNYMCAASDCKSDKDPLKDYYDTDNGISGTKYDVANVMWGGLWQMPTSSQVRELWTYCTIEWAKNYNGTGVTGLVVTGNGAGYENNSIFLPFCRYGVSTIDKTTVAYYFYPDEKYFREKSRYEQTVIRPVCSPESSSGTTKYDSSDDSILK